MPLLTFFLLYQMLSYGSFKTRLSQLLAEKDHEKHQPVKNVDTRKYQWTSSNLKALIFKETVVHYYPILSIFAVSTFHFSVLYFIEPCVCVYAMKHPLHFKTCHFLNCFV